MYQVFTSNGAGMSLVQEVEDEATATAYANALAGDGTFVQVERREGGMSAIVLKLNEPQPPAADPAPTDPVV